MSTIHTSNPVGDRVLAREGLGFKHSLSQHPLLAGIFTSMAVLTLLLAAVGVASANVATPSPTDSLTEDAGTISYDECVAAVLYSFGPAEAASSAPSQNIVNAQQGADKGEDPPEPPDVEEVHPNSPAHELCAVLCPEDEQCERSSEFKVVDSEDEQLASFTNPDLYGASN